MSENIYVENLLESISNISEKYKIIYQKTGVEFNIFDILDVESDELKICKVIYELINPEGKHYQGNKYLKLFIEHVLKINEIKEIEDMTEEELASVRVFREYRIKNNRKIDLVIKTSKRFIPIEVKIFSGDQKNQCADYLYESKNSNMYYLTLEGDIPSKISVGNIKPILKDEEIIGYERISIISFKNEILKWIEECLKDFNTINISSIKETLLQFRRTIMELNNLIGDDEMEEIKDIILKSEKNISAAFEISKSLDEVKTEIMKNFFEKLSLSFNEENEKRFIDKDAIKNYYSNTKNKNYPFIRFHIFSLEKYEKDLYLSFNICINHYLYYDIDFSKKDSKDELEILDIKYIKKKYSDMFNKVEIIIKEVFGTENEFDSQSITTYVDKKHNFKKFDENCIALSNDNKMNEEVERISKYYLEKILEIETKLKNSGM